MTSPRSEAMVSEVAARMKRFFSVNEPIRPGSKKVVAVISRASPKGHFPSTAHRAHRLTEPTGS